MVQWSNVLLLSNDQLVQHLCVCVHTCGWVYVSVCRLYSYPRMIVVTVTGCVYCVYDCLDIISPVWV